MEVRTKKDEEYSRSTLLGFRNSIERHLKDNGVTVKISKNRVFQNSNKILDAKLRINRHAGKENIQHKPVIVPSDLAKFEPARSSVWQLQPDCWEERGSTFRFTGAGVEEKATVLSSRVMPVAASTQWLNHEEATKNHPGGENSKCSAERETRLYSTGEDDDAFATVWKFLCQN